jgi:hypothetical protein
VEFKAEQMNGMEFMPFFFVLGEIHDLNHALVFYLCQASIIQKYKRWEREECYWGKHY